MLNFSPIRLNIYFLHKIETKNVACYELMAPQKNRKRMLDAT